MLSSREYDMKQSKALGELSNTGVEIRDSSGS